MERAVSGRVATFFGIVEAGRGGGGQAPTGGLDKPTTAPRIESVILYPVSYTHLTLSTILRV